MRNNFNDNDMDKEIEAARARREAELAEEEREYNERSSDADYGDPSLSAFEDDFAGFGFDGWSESDELGAMSSRVADRRYGF